MLKWNGKIALILQRKDEDCQCFLSGRESLGAYREKNVSETIVRGWNQAGNRQEQIAELMYSDQEGNISFCGPFGFNYESFFNSFLWLGPADKRGASEGWRI